MKRLIGLVLTLAVLGLGETVNAGDIKVMTQNEYLGADLAPVLAAPDSGALNNALVAALREAAANEPAARIKALAAEIAKQQPDLVGLQEVFVFQCVDLDGDFQPTAPVPGHGCNDPSIAGTFVDFLKQTLDDLGGTYVAKAVVVNLNLTSPGIPFVIDGYPALLQVVDRNVILARSGVAATPVDFSAYQSIGICLKASADGCNYQTGAQLTLPGPTGPVTIAIERGFVAVDATVGGKSYRFVNTHLEVRDLDPTNPLSAIYQSAQAAELIATLAVTAVPVESLIVVGDTNSAPEDETIVAPPPLNEIVPPYQQFLAAGYTDTWTLRPGKVPGLTCCQAGDLSNHKSALYQRVDLILSTLLPAGVKKPRVVGANVSDKTPPPGLGLWPSDHGGVVTGLLFY